MIYTNSSDYNRFRSCNLARSGSINSVSGPLPRCDYKVKFYKNLENDSIPVLEYIERLSDKEKAKVLKYIAFLKDNKGVLDEPYSKHIKGKIRELRVDFSKNRHRIFYFTFIGKNIILLHAFLKNTPKTPLSEIKKAEENYCDVLRNQKIYESR